MRRGLACRRSMARACSVPSTSASTSPRSCTFLRKQQMFTQRRKSLCSECLHVGVRRILPPSQIHAPPSCDRRPCLSCRPDRTQRPAGSRACFIAACGLGPPGSSALSSRRSRAARRSALPWSFCMRAPKSFTFVSAAFLDASLPSSISASPSCAACVRNVVGLSALPAPLLAGRRRAERRDSL